MNWFNKICAVLAGLVGLILLVIGALGLFVGSSASFRLPPILGVFPAFVGWGIVWSIWIAWRRPQVETGEQHPCSTVQSLSAQDWHMAADARRELDNRLFGDHDEQR